MDWKVRSLDQVRLGKSKLVRLRLLRLRSSQTWIRSVDLCRARVERVLMGVGNCRHEAVNRFEDAVAPSRSGITALTTQREQAQVMQLLPSAQAPSVFLFAQPSAACLLTD